MHSASPHGYAVVTGGGSGIGRAFCHALAEKDWCVAAADIDVAAAGETARRIAGAGGAARAEPLDVADAASWRDLRGRLTHEWPQLDLVVNCAGILVAADLADCEAGDLKRLVDINLTGTLLGCQSMAPWLASGPRQSDDPPPGVINVASIFAALSPPGFAAYSASKAGVVALTEAVRGELRPHKLNATVALPGVTPTRLFDRAVLGDPHLASLARQYVAASRITPEMVARQTLRAARRRQLYAVIGGRSRRLWWLKRLLPQQLVDRIARRSARERAQHPAAAGESVHIAPVQGPPGRSRSA